MVFIALKHLVEADLRNNNAEEASLKSWSYCSCFVGWSFYGEGNEPSETAKMVKVVQYASLIHFLVLSKKLQAIQ